MPTPSTFEQLFNVAPCFSANNVGNSSLVSTELVGNPLKSKHTPSVHISYPTNLIICENGIRIFRAYHSCFSPMVVAALESFSDNCISRVVCVCSKIKMIGIRAFRIVAFVKNPHIFRNLSIVKNPRNSMRGVQFSISYHFPVTRWFLGSRPSPTSIFRLYDSFPKSIPKTPSVISDSYLHNVSVMFFGLPFPRLLNWCRHNGTFNTEIHNQATYL